MKEYGSIINHVLSNSATEYTPEMGKHWRLYLGATMLCWSDRYPYQIVEIHVKGGTITRLVAQAMKYEADPTKDNRIGHENWIISENLNGEKVVLKWRKSKNGWYAKGRDGRGWGERFLIGHAEYHYDWSF